MPTVSGPEILERLGRRGTALFSDCQKLAAACGEHGAQQLLDCLHGRSNKWPTPTAPGAEKLRASVVRTWTQLTVDIHSYAEQFAAGQPGTSVKDFEDYCRNHVLAKVPLEATTAPAQLSHSAANELISESDVAALKACGVVVLSRERVISASAGFLDVRRLQSELALLHKHGVISPTNSTCNPGAHGVNLRCGTAAERANYGKQRTPNILCAMDLLRALPHALERCGYRFLEGTEQLAVPGVCLVSAYPSGAHYSRHLDCYGEDNARALTCILYANDDDWELERDGGSLVLEPPTPTTRARAAAAKTAAAAAKAESVEVTPSGGTLVIFESRTVWHAVRPSKKLRYATTLWVYASPRSASSPPPPSQKAPPPDVRRSKPKGRADQLPQLQVQEVEAHAGVSLPGVSSACPLVVLSRDERGGTSWAFATS